MLGGSQHFYFGYKKSRGLNHSFIPIDPKFNVQIKTYKLNYIIFYRKHNVYLKKFLKSRFQKDTWNFDGIRNVAINHRRVNDENPVISDKKGTDSFSVIRIITLRLPTQKPRGIGVASTWCSADD